ncbi:hypothetical protein GCM10025883_28700 [Mobilicoccus caccae]|uniref:PrgI family protein n=1 Tax=Mobilicoccus caccae TaxID=1859295 RepID=A0ABQ6ISB4_9MICO|nr:hypothetical protein GCM10025883_28700 [Mobilicoccus caccae]
MTSPYKRPTAEVGTVTFGKNRSASGDWALDALESIVGAVLRVLVGIPILGLAVVAGSVSWWWSLDHGWQVPAIALGGLLGLAVLLRVAAPALFERCVADPIVSSWRKTVLYERWWQPTMACSGSFAGHLGSRLRTNSGVARPVLTAVDAREVGSHFSGWLRCWVRVWARR